MCCASGCDAGAERSLRAWQLEVSADESGSSSRFGPIEVEFDRRLSPWSVDRSSVRLRSGAVGEFVFPSFDPIRRTLIVELTRPLLADTSYVLTLVELIDLDGETLSPSRELVVRAVDANEPPLPAPFQLAAVLEIFVSRCANAGCHDATERAADVVLDGPRGLRDTVLGRRSPQMASSSTLAEGTASGLIDLPIVDATGTSQSASRSYLLYKVLADPHVLGERMPPPAAGSPLSTDEATLIARWIRAGAPLE